MNYLNQSIYVDSDYIYEFFQSYRVHTHSIYSLCACIYILLQIESVLHYYLKFKDVKIYINGIKFYFFKFWFTVFIMLSLSNHRFISDMVYILNYCSYLRIIEYIFGWFIEYN